MADQQIHNHKLKFGLYASLSLAILTFITFGLAMMAVPPSGPYCPGNCMTYPYTDLLDYYPRDYIWMYLAIFQLFAFLIFMVVNHNIANVEKRLFSSISMAFAFISATVLLIAYYTQFSIVPVSMMNNETEGIALITQYNGHGFFIALEELGYITMSIALLFLAPLFSGNKALEKTLRYILVGQVILNIMAFIAYAIQFGIERDYRFEVATISINWLVLITIGILISVFYKRKLKEIPIT